MGAGVLALGEFLSTAFGIFDHVGIAEGISTGILLCLRVHLLSSVQIILSRVYLLRVLVYSWSTSGSTARGTLYGQDSSSYRRRGERYIIPLRDRVDASFSQASSEIRGERDQLFWRN